MDWLPQPFSSLSGPEFLLVYAAFAAAVIVVSRLQVTSADRSLTVPLPPVSVERDPFEIAYLRGGGNELLRFAIFEAIRRNVLRLAAPAKGKKQSDRIEAVSAELPPGDSTPLLAELVQFYAQPRTTVELFASGLPAAAETFGAARYGPALEAEHFLTEPAARGAARRVFAYGFLALLAFAGLRLLEAFARHHRNVGFLMLETVAGVMVLLASTYVGRLSRRGRAYLDRLKAALRPVSGLAPAAAGAGMLPVFVAATGMSALAGTEYAPIQRLFPRGAGQNGGSSGCGGGSGSSCGGGSGCGGGGCGG